MTTRLDKGTAEVEMLPCPLHESTIYPTLTLALRDMRRAHGRNATTGGGRGTESWIGLSIGMIVLDTLSGMANGVETRWLKLLTSHGVTSKDAELIYKVRCSLLHGYGPPKKVGNRRVYLTQDQDAYALDTSRKALLSVPVFCRTLVERIAFEAHGLWDVSEIDTNFEL
jgi:hypothetical protein